MFPKLTAMPGVALMMGMLSFIAPARALAHCDGMDGPVVTAARQALESGEVARALIWVRAQDEAVIRESFARTMRVRTLGADARELADLYFFETLVRVHRAGEGEPYTGLHPAGRNLGPAIPAADRALESGNVDALVKLLVEAVERGTRAHFRAAHEARNHRAADVAAGRAYVAKYVPFLHYVERIHASARTEAGHEAASAGPHQH